MKLSQYNAELIVSEINEIINEKMNIMDSNGIIIASTDESRIGKMHAGARRIIDEHLEELEVSYDDEYEGSKPGINYPLIVKGEIIGVIGVTGRGEKTLALAKIIKRMTEILVLEIILKEEKEREVSIRNRFLEEWLNGDVRNVNKNFVERGKALGIDITLPRRMMAFSIVADTEDNKVETLKRVDEADKYLQKMVLYDKDNISMHTASYLIVGVTLKKDSEMKQRALDYKTYIENRFKVKVAVGIDSVPNEGYLMAYQSVIKARKALQSSLRRKNHEIRFYDNINLELISDEVPEIAKIEYIHKIFRGMSDEQINEAMRILEIYYESEGSINQSAQKLFMHKNTMQNKLKQLYEITSFDPRSIRYTTLYYLALYFYREVREEFFNENISTDII